VAKQATWAAWLVLASLYLLLLALDTALASARGIAWRLVTHALLALIAGITPIAIAQVESNFAAEEFFIALESLSLSSLWLLLLGAHRLLARPRMDTSQRGLHIDSRWLILLLSMALIAGGVATTRAYQGSFYPSEAPEYEGISVDSPFICGQVPPSPRVFDGEDVFDSLLARVEANPHKGTPEYGMLALGTGKPRWAEAFRDSIVSEAAKGLYTGPANSVKSVQHLAALRAYYYPHVRDAFPGLFSNEDVTLLRDWFAAINDRTLTVEWVDLMYALAFAKWPEGPYENQENGAGLLALLESGELAAPGSSPANQEHLEHNCRGWEARFRNTDDAFIYQLEWIENAFFQSVYASEESEVNMELSFDWLMAQALPDAAPLRYNHPARPSLAGIAYLGAHLLKDPHFVWLAGQALRNRGEEAGNLFAQPGVESPVRLKGHSPSTGSCLIYGDSGLPNQVGPLAPDKIVFRDGWSEDSIYLLLNLRFSGWHRYRATNTITLIYQDGSLAGDVLSGETSRWLPQGRSLFRDKRIPRENLNGLLVGRTGMSAVLHTLTGMGRRWAQDPPYYAEVVDFETGDELDWSHTQLAYWRGWQHDRWIYFYHGGGPIIVVDEAKGASKNRTALAWHLKGTGVVKDERVRLQDKDTPLEVVLVPIGSEGKFEVANEDTGSSNTHITYYPTVGDEMHLATLFLPGQWVGARAELDAANRTLRVAREGLQIVLPLQTR
jgi:hypothetical protein